MKKGDRRTLTFVEDKSKETKVEVQKKKVIVHVKDEPVATAGQIASSSSYGSSYKSSTVSSYKSNTTSMKTNTFKSNPVVKSTNVNTFSNAKSKFENQGYKKQTPQPVSKRPPPTPKKNKRTKAMYDYQASADDEISFKEGDIIIVLEQHPDGWWFGELNGKKGLFPGNYTELIN